MPSKSAATMHRPRIKFDPGQRIEQHTFGPLVLNVIREDLHPRAPLPAHGKMSALNAIVKQAASDGYTTIGCFGSQVSDWMTGLPPLCAAYGVRAHIIFPATGNTKLPSWLTKCMAEWGGYTTLQLLRPNMLAINTSQAKRIFDDEGAYMIPFGLATHEGQLALIKRFTYKHDIGTLIASAGSGVALCCMMNAAHATGNTIEKVYAISAGRSVASLYRTLNEFAPDHEQVTAGESFYIHFGYQHADSYEFPAMWDMHPNYEGKCVDWLLSLTERELRAMPAPVYFLNMGGRPK